MLQGVVDMHDAGWAHLDIKPDNCMHGAEAQHTWRLLLCH